MTAQHRFSAVFGPSGSGKSSLLRAGLIPALREHGSGPVAAIRILTPGEQPLRTHAGVLQATVSRTCVPDRPARSRWATSRRQR
ncbi:nSTAND1 domain-containing NTPase [Streptomyces tricolor]